MALYYKTYRADITMLAVTVPYSAAPSVGPHQRTADKVPSEKALRQDALYGN